MAPTPNPDHITFHLKLDNTEVTVRASTLAELLDGTRLGKMEMTTLWGIDSRTYHKRREFPGGVTQDELHRLAAALKVSYLDIARLIYQQCEADPSARKARGKAE